MSEAIRIVVIDSDLSLFGPQDAQPATRPRAMPTTPSTTR